MNANLAYVAMTRETHKLEIITDNTGKLGESICKFAERQSAMEASKAEVTPDMKEIQNARREADHELGQTGDLSEKRALEVEPELEGSEGLDEQPPQPEEKENEDEMEL